MAVRFGGGSFLSASDLRLNFGLGTAKKADRVEVTWPSGGRDSYQGLAADTGYKLARAARSRAVLRASRRRLASEVEERENGTGRRARKRDTFVIGGARKRNGGAKRDRARKRDRSAKTSKAADTDPSRRHPTQAADTHPSRRQAADTDTHTQATPKPQTPTQAADTHPSHPHPSRRHPPLSRRHPPKPQTPTLKPQTPTLVLIGDHAADACRSKGPRPITAFAPFVQHCLDWNLDRRRAFL